MRVQQLSPTAEEKLFSKLGNWLPVQKPGEDILQNFVNQYQHTFSYRILIDSRSIQKTWERCIQKVLQYVEVGKASNEIDAIENCLKDIAGARLIVLFPSDREVAVRRFRAYVVRQGTEPPIGLPSFQLDGDQEVKNYESGYKAIHQGILLRIDNKAWFPFEIQFMNVMQHMWDKIQGPLYREPSRYPPMLQRRVRLLSKTCEQICNKTDQVLTDMVRYRRKNR